MADNSNWQWVTKYLSSDQIDKVSRRLTPQTYALKREWAGLIREVESAIAGKVSPTSPQARALASRWKELSEFFSAGDTAIVAARQKMYAEASGDPAVAALLPSTQVRQFIAAAGA